LIASSVFGKNIRVGMGIIRSGAGGVIDREVALWYHFRA